MSAVSGKETKPEIVVRKYLFSQGFRYRKNLKTLPGTPDIVLLKYNAIVLVNGCFWHGHKGCKASKLPQTRKAFWKEKISKNIERDKKTIAQLKKLGWKVLLVWQCEIKTIGRRKARLERLVKEIRADSV